MPMVLTVLACVYKPFTKCKCEHWSARLIVEGFFPTKARPGVAISLDLLELFLCHMTNGPFSKQGNAFAIRHFHRYKLRFEPLKRYDEIFRAAVPFYLRVKRFRDESLERAFNSFFETLSTLDMFLPDPATSRNQPDGTATATAPQTAETRSDARGQGMLVDDGGSRSRSELEDTVMLDAPPLDTQRPQPNDTANPTSVPPSAPTTGGKYPFVTLGTLVSQCPACFYRKPSDDGPVICGLDGNMQHCRYSHVAKSFINNLSYGERIFFPVPLQDREKVNAISQVVAGTICEHNFKATSKPATMTFKDETGLLMIVCR